ncbi:MAG: APC family permease [Bryobacteraceae bacterium]
MSDPVRLKRSLRLWDLIFYGILVIQPTAPMPPFGVVSQLSQGHAATAILLAMAAMMLTAVSYGRMAAAYPSAGSAFTYVGREIHPTMGFVTGWLLALDYLLNPLICTIWCSKAAMNAFPATPYVVWALFFASLFTWLNLHGIQSSARTAEILVALMSIVIVAFFFAAVRYLFGEPSSSIARAFYNPATFSWSAVTGGTSVAVLTYIGFDAVSTLSEEVENPRRNVLLATVWVCLITGVLSVTQVALAQAIWPDFQSYPDVDTAFVHVAGRAGGDWLFHVLNVTLLVATVGSGSGAQLAGARMLYGMGRDGVLPRSFFGAIDAKRRIPRNNVIFAGVVAIAGALTMSFQLGAELLNFGAIAGFIGVNAAAFLRYYWRSETRRWRDGALPLGGFLICLLLWVRLRPLALAVGGAWMLAGIGYAAWKTGGFRRSLELTDSPPEEET